MFDPNDIKQKMIHIFNWTDEKINNPILKWAKNLNICSSEEDTQMANKHMKRCSTSSVIKETHIRAIRRHHFVCTRMTLIKKD